MTLRFLFLGVLFVANLCFTNSVVKAQVSDNKIPIEGSIYNGSNEKIPSVSIRGNNVVLGHSDSLGNFKFSVSHTIKELGFSAIGYFDTVYSVRPGKNTVTIVMRSKLATLDDIVVNNGMFSRKKENFTGAVGVYSGDKVRSISNGNLIQSLKTFDPSFVVMTNNIAGANPNALPNIELRGKSSITVNSSSSISDQFSNNANLPLFILNGFETSLQQVVDLDINRIKSVTLLKDAASTAIYGGKAANGVVVIETIVPKPGSLLVSYTNDFRIESAFLSDYNMMSAAENLEFQRLSGYYGVGYDNQGEDQVANQDLYNSRLKKVLSGVNTYWLNVPLRKLGITESNSLNLNGGSKEFQFNVQLNRRTINGLMKGSNRNTWGGNAYVQYTNKNLTFFSNTYLNGTESNESPYGSFSTYVNLSPYYKKYNDDGSINDSKYLEEYYFSPISTRRLQ